MKNLNSDLGLGWSLPTFLLAQDLQKYLIKKMDWVPLQELKNRGFDRKEWDGFPLFDMENALFYLIQNDLIITKRDQIGQIQSLKSRLLDRFNRKVSYFELLESFFEFNVSPDLTDIYLEKRISPECQDPIIKIDSNSEADLDQPHAYFFAFEDNTFYFGDFLTRKWTQIDYSNPFLYLNNKDELDHTEKAWADLVISILLQDLRIKELPLVRKLHTILVRYYERNFTEILDKWYHWEAILE